MSYFHLWHWKQDFECKSLSVWLLDTSRMTEGWPYIRAADKSPSRYTVAVSVSLSLFLVPLAFSMIVSGNCVMNEYVWESMPQLCEHTHARARRTQQIKRQRNRPKIEFVFVIICWYEWFVYENENEWRMTKRKWKGKQACARRLAPNGNSRLVLSLKLSDRRSEASASRCRPSDLYIKHHKKYSL